MALLPETTEVRVLVRDTKSQALGSVTVPAEALLEGVGAGVKPAKAESPK
jgi:hypothetical protein